MKGIENAYNTCDVELMKSLLHSDFNVYNDQGTVDMPGGSDICANGQSFEFSFEVVDISRFANTAIALYHGKGFFIPSQGEKSPVNSKVTTVWIKEDNKWLIKHAHISPIADQ